MHVVETSDSVANESGVLWPYVFGAKVHDVLCMPEYSTTSRPPATVEGKVVSR
jgi:hypothetical protein